GNAGSGTHLIALTTTSSQSLSVFITSPVANTVFNRGESTMITALVTLNGSPISGATVTANSPTDATLTLTNTAGGTYSDQYTILGTDPAGTWTVVLHATLNGQTATSQEALTIYNSVIVAVSPFVSRTH